MLRLTDLVADVVLESKVCNFNGGSGEYVGAQAGIFMLGHYGASRL